MSNSWTFDIPYSPVRYSTSFCDIATSYDQRRPSFKTIFSLRADHSPGWDERSKG
ncbi:hypothetical protein [Rhodohalobacter sp. SW132]|uniref:hypothetical protein n=1 Tax=Rhodohalobacter sp. SW132 TaxID=2293433 RepID=UPI0013156326|nr:hypothetical protein [Rhodohalobacter sp. SW132]